MGMLTILRKMRQKEREMRLLILGLDNAGKTTILKRFNGEDIDKISPTLGEYRFWIGWTSIVSWKHGPGGMIREGCTRLCETKRGLTRRTFQASISKRSSTIITN